MGTLHPEYLPDQMWLLIQEQSFLWEIKDEMIEYAKPDRIYRAGPWSQADCVAVLMAWLDTGWLELAASAGWFSGDTGEWVEQVYETDWISRATRDEQHYWTLAISDARELLLNPFCWDGDGPAVGVIVCNSHESRDRTRDEWINVLGDVAKRSNGG